MKQLKCQNCGGVLEYDEEDVRVFEGNVVMWLPKDRSLTCRNCGSKFERGDDLAHDRGTVAIVGDGNIVVGDISNSSGVVIGGGNIVIHGDVVGRNHTVIRRS